MTAYAPMTAFLTGQAIDRVRIGFRDMEQILGRPLPKSAEDYQAWWANDPTHSQAKAWLDAGWRTKNLNLGGRTVEFVRVGKPVSPSTPAAPPPDPWGALAGTVTILDEAALTAPSGELWDAEASGR